MKFTPEKIERLKDTNEKLQVFKTTASELAVEKETKLEPKSETLDKTLEDSPILVSKSNKLQEWGEAVQKELDK